MHRAIHVADQNRGRTVVLVAEFIPGWFQRFAVAAPVRNDNNNINNDIITVRNDTTKRSTTRKWQHVFAHREDEKTTLLLGKTRSNNPNRDDAMLEV